MSVHLFFEFLTAFVGTIAFALLFQVPKEYYVNCGLAGGCGWICYKLLLAGCGLFGSTFFATVLVVFLSRLSAVRRHCPVTIFLVAGIFPLVPGAGIYWTAYYVVTDQLAKASDRGFQTLKIAVAIVLGILFVFEFPQKWFRVGGARYGCRQLIRTQHFFNCSLPRPTQNPDTSSSVLRILCKQIDSPDQFLICNASKKHAYRIFFASVCMLFLCGDIIL